jgi:hypothetical protein
MRVLFTLESSHELSITHFANTLVTLHKLYEFCAFLALPDDERFSRDRVGIMEVFLRELLGSQNAKYLHRFTSLSLNHVHYGSPVEIEATTAPSVGNSRIREIFALIRGFLTLTAVQEKAHWEAEITRQRAIEAALKNSERVLQLSKKIKTKPFLTWLLDSHI